ncbi:uncharacterized protein [Musca autumnalis]|uniref:uncharacterized protein n=1 Tax=Musca autumnalis TaxID=221902 RepID=UPI003CF77980
MAWMHRYIQNFCRKFKKVELLKGELSAEEEAWAEQYLCRNVQMEVFADEIADIGLHGHVTLGIQWKFNTPANPSEGGAWERLVQSVKKSLNAMLREHSPRFETLQSFLIEAENMINSRPLTHLAVSPEDPDPLTPNHFLLGCANSTQTPAPFEPRLMSLRKQWRIVKNLKKLYVAPMGSRISA